MEKFKFPLPLKNEVRSSWFGYFLKTNSYGVDANKIVVKSETVSKNVNNQNVNNQNGNNQN